METDLGLLLLRLALAALLAGHACQKLFGWFRGRGIRGTAPLFEADGLRPGTVMVTFAGLTEVGAAGLLVLGLAMPLAAAMVIGAMAAAMATLWPKGLWAHLGGFEVPLTYAIVAFVLACTGPGAVSIDALLPWQLHGPLWAIGAAALALALAAPLLLRVARHRRAADGSVR
ncbi:DoxX family protein [Agrococcus sp. ARC_14]|uniref:DoxX family protein n=1 Tax=Agrococcus sp. ARC_14 TaxID=2919927 RepID=UPI001F06332D|nr:DoxX family protein [Agrococcus sp. ARC_14]MCH1881357.1 DoxX family protein [Agrococcus sp. ARC_14]